MASLPFSPNFEIASILYIIRAFLMNPSNPLVQSLIMGLVSKDERGAAAGINVAIWRLPNSLSTVLGSAMLGYGLISFPFCNTSLFSFYIFILEIFQKRGENLIEEKAI